MFMRAGNTTVYIPTSSNHSSEPEASCEEQYAESTIGYNDCVAQRETADKIGGIAAAVVAVVGIGVIIWAIIECVRN